MTKIKYCPLLIQSGTRSSYTVEGERFTRTYMMRCHETMCAAYDPEQGKRNKFGTIVKIEEESKP